MGCRVIGTRLKDAPVEIDDLAEILNIAPKRLIRLKEKHGDNLLSVLQHQWWESRDLPRLMHRRSEQGYTSTPTQALAEEPEAIGKRDQDKISAEAHSRFADMRAEKIAQERTKVATRQLRRIEARAREKGIDTLPHLIKIESEIRALEELAA
jgi:hypothetical protein